MKQKAVVDRFEGDKAVLLLEEGKKQLDVPRASLPKDVREGAWLQVELDGETPKTASLDVEETNRARERIEDKLGRLRRGEHLKRPPGTS